MITDFLKKNLLIVIPIIAAALVAWMPSYAQTNCQGIGGTGRAVDCGIGGTGHDGIGGTGITANQAGIGGTGHGPEGIGGTGIVGIITGFGSIWVNGLEVQFDAKTAIQSNNGITSTNDLAIGQVVVIEATGETKNLSAGRIAVLKAVTGEVAQASATEFVVLGQTVELTPETKSFIDGKATETSVHSGEKVSISGLRKSDGKIVATRIDHVDAKAASSLVGTITKIDGKNLEINGMPVTSNTENTYSVGQEVVATGTVVNGTLVADKLAISPMSLLYRSTAQISLEGYAGAVNADGQVKVGNMDVIVSGQGKEIKGGELIQITGRFDKEHRIIADRIEFVRDRIERGHIDDAARGHESAEKPEHFEREDHGEHIEHGVHIDRPDMPDRTYNSDTVKQHTEHSER